MFVKKIVMKNILKLIVFISLFSSCEKIDSKESDWAKEGLKGKVNLVKSKVYEVKYELGVLKKAEETYSNSGSLQFGVTEKTYDANGNLLKKIEVSSFSETWHNNFKTVYLYDEKGNIEKSTFFHSKGRDRNKVRNENTKYEFKNQNEFICNDYGKIIKKTEWLTTDGINKNYCSSITTYKYNILNDLIEEINFNDNCKGAIISSRVIHNYKYDNDDNIIQIETKEILEKDSQFGWDLAIYSMYPKGYISETKNYDSNNNEIITKYFSVPWRSKNSNSMNPDDFTLSPYKKIEEIIRKFDKFNNVVEKKSEHNSTIKTWKFEYKYDSQDNWTEKTIYFEGKPKNIIEREIIYF